MSAAYVITAVKRRH